MWKSIMAISAGAALGALSRLNPNEGNPLAMAEPKDAP